MSQIMPQMCISEFVWMHVRFRLPKSTSQGGHHLRQSIRIPRASIPCLDHDVQGVSFWVVVTQIKQIHFHTFSWWAVAMATDGLQHFLFSPTQHNWILPFMHMILAMALTLDPLNRNKNCKIKIHRHTSHANLCSGCCKQNRAPPQTMGRNPAKGCQRYARFAPLRKNSETIYCNLMIDINII